MTEVVEAVLILVLMEDTLREIQKLIRPKNQVTVLILVLMEDTLRAMGDASRFVNHVS